MGLFKKQKDPVVEMEKDLVHEENGMEHDIQADVDAVMKKYDRESNTRVWEGIPKTMLRALMASFSVYCILMTLFSKALPERRLSLFLFHRYHRLSGVPRQEGGYPGQPCAVV